jgi:hypothetical protein
MKFPRFQVSNFSCECLKVKVVFERFALTCGYGRLIELGVELERWLRGAVPVVRRRGADCHVRRLRQSVLPVVHRAQLRPPDPRGDRRQHPLELLHLQTGAPPRSYQRT